MGRIVSAELKQTPLLNPELDFNPNYLYRPSPCQ